MPENQDRKQFELIANPISDPVLKLNFISILPMSDNTQHVKSVARTAAKVLNNLGQDVAATQAYREAGSPDPDPKRVSQFVQVVVDTLNQNS